MRASGKDGARTTTDNRSTDPQLQAAIEGLLSADRTLQRQSADTLQLLQRSDAMVAVVLRRLLSSAEPRQRWLAAYALARFGAPDPVVLDQLLDALASPDSDLRWGIADLLMHCVPPPGAALQQLLTNGNEQQQKMSAHLLRQMRASSPQLDQTLFDCFAHGGAKVRVAVLSCLAACACDRTRAVDIALAALDDDELTVRRAAAAILPKFQDSRDVVRTALQAAAQGVDASTRKAAERALQLLWPHELAARQK